MHIYGRGVIYRILTISYMYDTINSDPLNRL